MIGQTATMKLVAPPVSQVSSFPLIWGFKWFFFFKGLLVEVIIGAQIRKQTATNRNTIKLNPKSKTAVTGTVQSLDSVDN